MTEKCICQDAWEKCKCTTVHHERYHKLLELKNNLIDWRKQIIEFSYSEESNNPEYSFGPLYSIGINNARSEILDKLDELLDEK